MKQTLCGVVISVLVWTSASGSTILWNEVPDGDLSAYSTTTNLTVVNGTNQIIGSVHAYDDGGFMNCGEFGCFYVPVQSEDIDAFNLVVPTGGTITSASITYFSRAYGNGQQPDAVNALLTLSVGPNYFPLLDAVSLGETCAFNSFPCDTDTIAVFGDSVPLGPGSRYVRIEDGLPGFEFVHRDMDYVLTFEATVVPIPAATWLFGSALGLMGWMRRKTSG